MYDIVLLTNQGLCNVGVTLKYNTTTATVDKLASEAIPRELLWYIQGFQLFLYEE